MGLAKLMEQFLDSIVLAERLVSYVLFSIS